MAKYSETLAYREATDLTNRLELGLAETYPEAERQLEIGYVPFSHVSRRLHMQTQYASHYVEGNRGTPDLGNGFRIGGHPGDYHALRIHRDDVSGFVQRVLDYRLEVGAITVERHAKLSEDA